MKRISFVTYHIMDTFSMTSLLNLTFSQWRCQRFEYSGMWRCVLMQTVPNISNNCSALIFRFKESIKIMLDPEHKSSEVKSHKWSEMRWSAVYGREGGEQVFMEKVYRSSKWWEVKDWGESISELMIKKKISKNCTQYSLTWVFLPFVHVYSNLSHVFCC